MFCTEDDNSEVHGRSYLSTNLNNKTEQEHTYVRFPMKLDNLKLSKRRSEIWNIMPY